MSWIVVETYSLQEPVTIKEFKRHSLEFFYPTREYEIRHRRHVELRVGPLYPRYVFANVDLNDPYKRWTRIFSMRGVKHVLGRPTPVADDIIRVIGYVSHSDVLKPGEHVLLKAWGVEGLFSEKVDDRYRVLFQFMGKDVHLDVPRLEIERLAA